MATIGESDYRTCARERLDDAFLLLRQGSRSIQTVRDVMAKLAYLTKERLAKILTERLSLRDPQFLLKRYDGRVVGNIISPTFKGKGDYERHGMIWDALEDELGADFAKQAGMFLAYTPDEWNLGAERAPKTKRQKVGRAST